MSTLAIVLIAIAALLVLLFAGGLAGNARRRRAMAHHLRARIEAADQALAVARAEDRGWDADAMREAALVAYAQRFDGREPDELALVQVVDRPGTEKDEAIFRAVAADQESDVRLGREAGRWVAR